MAYFIEQLNKNDAGHREVIISSEMKVVGLDLKGNGRFDCNSQPETALFAWTKNDYFEQIVSRGQKFSQEFHSRVCPLS